MQLKTSLNAAFGCSDKTVLHSASLSFDPRFPPQFTVYNLKLQRAQRDGGRVPVITYKEFSTQMGCAADAVLMKHTFADLGFLFLLTVFNPGPQGYGKLVGTITQE